MTVAKQFNQWVYLFVCINKFWFLFVSKKSVWTGTEWKNYHQKLFWTEWTKVQVWKCPYYRWITYWKRWQRIQMSAWNKQLVNPFLLPFPKLRLSFVLEDDDNNWPFLLISLNSKVSLKHKLSIYKQIFVHDLNMFCLVSRVHILAINTPTLGKKEWEIIYAFKCSKARTDWWSLGCKLWCWLWLCL